MLAVVAVGVLAVPGGAEAALFEADASGSVTITALEHAGGGAGIIIKGFAFNADLSATMQGNAMAQATGMTTILANDPNNMVIGDGLQQSVDIDGTAGIAEFSSAAAFAFVDGFIDVFNTTADPVSVTFQLSYMMTVNTDAPEFDSFASSDAFLEVSVDDVIVYDDFIASSSGREIPGGMMQTGLVTTTVNMVTAPFEFGSLGFAIDSFGAATVPEPATLGILWPLLAVGAASARRQRSGRGR
ncbi:MAG: hypothetical protein CMJ18_03020 [Phycisphaeraceae bacterium]|nr:hypothetical protein [Phycisphaeraceae bacterium]